MFFIWDINIVWKFFLSRCDKLTETKRAGRLSQERYSVNWYELITYRKARWEDLVFGDYCQSLSRLQCFFSSSSNILSYFSSIWEVYDNTIYFHVYVQVLTSEMFQTWHIFLAGGGGRRIVWVIMTVVVVSSSRISKSTSHSRSVRGIAKM